MSTSRDIRFRVWASAWKPPRMVTPEDIELYGCRDLHSALQTVLTSPLYTVEQFTGLQDCNGRDVFEGDILALYPDRWSRKLISNTDDGTPIYEIDTTVAPTRPIVDRQIYPLGHVVWHDDVAAFKLALSRPTADNVTYVSLDQYSYTIEVVGNRHENADLLTQSPLAE